MVEFNRRRREGATIELTPMIDVVFQLLVFFLLTSAMMAQAIPVDLPTASTGSERRKESVTLTLDAAGALYVEGAKVTRGELGAALRKESEGTPLPELRVDIAADGRNPHARVIELMDALRGLGVRRLGFQVDPIDDSP